MSIKRNFLANSTSRRYQMDKKEKRIKGKKLRKKNNKYHHPLP